MFKLNPVDRKPPEVLIAASRKEMNQLFHEIKDIQSCMLCSTDGFELATSAKNDLENGGKIAAVSSSILAMITAFTREIQLDECQIITLDTNNGIALISNIPCKNFPMVLVVISGKNALLGQLLHSIKQVTRQIIQHDAHYSKSR